MINGLHKLLVLLLWAWAEASRPNPLGFSFRAGILDGLRNSAFSILPYLNSQTATDSCMSEFSVDISRLRKDVNAGMIYVEDSFIQQNEVAALREDIKKAEAEGYFQVVWTK